MNNNNNKTPFCKVCFDSGKPDTKHWVKDRNNKVCCPTLLALKCRLCGQCGHTVKYCSKAQPTAKAVAPPPSKVQAKPTYKEQAPVAQQKAPINKFDLLYDDSDEEQEQEEQEQEQQVEVKKPEPEQKPSPPAVKRWIDYDSDSDDEPPLPIPTLKRYGHSDNSDDSVIEASM